MSRFTASLKIVYGSNKFPMKPVKKRRFDHILPVLHKLHWLPVYSRIEFKIATLTFKVLKFQQPAYIHDLIAPYIPPQSLRSSNKNLLIVHWAADHFPLLHLPFGILSLNIYAFLIHYLLSVVYSRPYIKSLFHHSYQ